MRRLVVTGLLALGGLLAYESTAFAQEIQLTGPLAGAPAVRNLRWHRKGRFELAPTFSVTLLDEYERSLLVGARINYNITDWLAVGLWGAYAVTNINLGLTDEIEKVNKARWAPYGSDRNSASKTVVDRNASVLSVGQNFPDQTGKLQWVLAAPQITAVPFRGKLAIFQKIFVDTDIYFFGGPAFVGLKERANFDPSKPEDAAKLATAPCAPPLQGDCVAQPKYDMASRVAIAPTFGFGMSFYMGKWMGLGLEYRALPFSWNTSGFDSRGGPPDDRGPDYKVDEKDRSFKFNQMITISFNMYLPAVLKSSP
ncbi:MAG: hypothetical protein HY898_20145 [Deltaproteobacteria bacterium]|nr:hypothetical protein [Deltaproteobacteria bacterium]